MLLIAELKRRNVFKVGAAYLALGWVVIQITATMTPAFNLPASALPLVTWIGLIGFPFAVLFAWIYELTPEGLKRESEVDRSASITHVTSRKLDYIIIGLMVAAIALYAVREFTPRGQSPSDVGAGPARDASSAGAGPALDPSIADDRAQGALLQTAPDPRSIAVLPFVDMSAAKDQDYMSDGIAEELLNLLAKIPELRVTSRSSAFAFKGEKIDIADVAAKLHVAHVLEGSVRTSGNRVRITAQLIDARADEHLWSDSYDRKLDDIFAVQDEIAAAVVGQLKIKLLGAAPRVKEVDPQAYALFLQGRQLRRQNTPEGLEQGIVLMQQALALDANYAAAWHDLAVIYINQAGSGLRPNDEAYRLSREAVNKALAIDPDFARAHDALGWIAMSYDGDLAAAAQHYQHALDLEPTNPAIIANSGALAQNIGRLDTAITLIAWSTSHDPLNTVGHANLGGTYLSAGRLDDAIASLRTALRLSPGYIGAQAGIGIALMLKGDAAAGLVEVQKETDEINRLAGLALVHHALGNQSGSDAAVAELMRKHQQEAAYLIADALAWRGEPDRAFEWLDKAVANHDAGLTGLPTDPLLAGIHEDPRWLPFVRRIGKAPEQLAAIPFKVKLPQ